MQHLGSLRHQSGGQSATNGSVKSHLSTSSTSPNHLSPNESPPNDLSPHHQSHNSDKLTVTLDSNRDNKL